MTGLTANSRGHNKTVGRAHVGNVRVTTARHHGSGDSRTIAPDALMMSRAAFPTTRCLKWCGPFSQHVTGCRPAHLLQRPQPTPTLAACGLDRLEILWSSDRFTVDVDGHGWRC